MEVTIEQALQQGVAAHNAGNLQEAERIYHAILHSQPKHPDASHNLGLIAISVNQIEAALPLFKTALNVNPDIEQFWISYIDALVKAKCLKDAKQAIKKAKKKGFNTKKLDTLLSLSKGVADTKVPSQQQLSDLLQHYQNGRFSDAEKLAVHITLEFPKHQFTWKILGVVLRAAGKNSEAVDANQTAVALSPQDAEAHSNLGVTLQELGRLEEAEASYNQAIALKPDYVDAHSNLGITLQILGRLDEAEVSYRQAIALKPDNAEAHNNLGNMRKELGRLDEAEASYTQAIALKPDYADAHSNLGITLQELGRLDEAEASYIQAIMLKPDCAEAYSNLGNTLKELGKLDEAEASYTQAIELKPDYAEARYNLGVILFDIGKYSLAAEHFALCDTHQSKLYGIKCSYLVDEEHIFYEKFDLLVSQGESNAVIGSLGFRSESKYGIKKPNPFCNDPLNYVVTTDLGKRYNFEKIFIKTAKDVLTDSSVSYKVQGLLTKGVQTSGNIFVQGKVPETEIESIIRAEIENYRIQFKDSEEGFVKKWPTSYEIRGWLVSMQSGGKLSSHMHDDGWITGSIYINVPPKSKTDCGNLVLCLSDQDHILGVEESHQSVIDVVTGRLCLFPSSLHHRTIPFEEKEDRIVLAFDVIPKN